MDERARHLLSLLTRLGVADVSSLASLSGIHVQDILTSLLRLEEEGWAVSHSVAVSVSERVRLYAPSPALMERAIRSHGEERVALLPWGPQEMAQRLAAAPLVLKLLQALRSLVEGARDWGFSVVRLRCLPLSRRASDSLPRGMAALCALRAGDSYAPLVLYLDHEDLPVEARQEAVRAWVRAAHRDPWLQAVPLLALAPGYDQERQWAQQAATSIGARRLGRVGICLADHTAIGDMWGERWRRWDTPRRATLLERLARLHRLPGPFAPNLSLPPQAIQGPPPGKREASLPARVAEALGLSGPMRETVCALLRHPLCDPAALAGYTALQQGAVEKALGKLVKRGLARAVDGRWLLTEEGRYVAKLCTGTAYLRRTAAPQARPTPHDLEVRDAGAALARLLEKMNGRLLRFTEAPLTRIEARSGGRKVAVTPDAIAEAEAEGRRLHLLIEWDRATIRGRRVQERLARYAALLPFLIREASMQETLVMVVVDSLPRREELRRALRNVHPLLAARFLVLTREAFLAGEWLRPLSRGERTGQAAAIDRT